MSTAIKHSVMSSPLGELLMTSDGRHLTGLYFPCHQQDHAPRAEHERDDAWFADVRRQLNAYFAGTLHEFDIPLAMSGTPFENQVWSALQTIPYGTTTSYSDVARRIGRPTACRAVGLANGRNPLPVIVPCHRVIGANGSLTGYGGGLDTKRWLLSLEGAEPQDRKSQQRFAAAK